MRRPVLLVLFSLCVSSQLNFADSAPIKVERAWIQAVPPVSDTTAAYMKIINLSGSPLKLTGASSPAAKTVEPMITTRQAQGEVIKLTIRFAPGDQKFDLEVPVSKEEPK